MIWQALIPALMTVLKWVIQARTKKKLSDKQFIEYILVYQGQKSRAGDAALDFETALEKAKKELEKELKEGV